MGNLPKLIKKKLSDVLLEEGLVRDQHMTEALTRQKTTGESLAAVLLKMGVLSEVELARAFCKQFNLPYLDAGRYSVPKDVAAMVPVADMKAGQFIALDKIGKTLLVAVAGEPPMEAMEHLEKSTGLSVFVVVSTPTQLLSGLEKLGPKGAGTAAKAAPPAKPAAQAAPK